MIYDCFTFYNELDLLELRLNILNDTVDKFVIVEMSKTHTGKEKPLYFDENKDRFSKFRKKIIHIKITEIEEPENQEIDAFGNKWFLENYQRHCILKGLEECEPEDIIIISDLDEIPNPEKIIEYKSISGIKTFDMPTFCYFVNYKSSEPHTYTAKMLTYGELMTCLDDKPLDEVFYPRVVEKYRRGTNPNKVRCFVHSEGNLIKDGGWHFSYLGGVEKIKIKMSSITEQQYNKKDILSETNITKMIKKGRDVYGRCYYYRAYELDENFPKYLIENEEKYSEFIFKVNLAYKIKEKIRSFKAHITKASIKLLCAIIPSKNIRRYLKGIYIPFLY